MWGQVASPLQMTHFVALLEGSLFSPSCFPYQIGARIKPQSPGSVKAE